MAMELIVMAPVAASDAATDPPVIKYQQVRSMHVARLYILFTAAIYIPTTANRVTLFVSLC